MPAGIACELAHVNPTIVFIVNGIAIIPLAGLLSFATESVASTLGDALGALLNVSFGNAVELIIFVRHLMLLGGSRLDANKSGRCMLTL